MIMRFVSYSILGSYKNPIWHLHAFSDLYPNSESLHPINEKTLIPFESLDPKLLNQVQKLNRRSKNNLQLQLSIDQIHYLEEIQSLDLTTQVWIDKKLSFDQFQQLKKYSDLIELIFIPNGHFDCPQEVQKVCHDYHFNCRMLIIPKISIHSIYPETETYYYWFESFKQKNLSVQKLISEKHFLSLKIPHQNLILNMNHQNLLNYVKNISTFQKLLCFVGQGLNLITFNYFSSAFMTLMNPTRPLLLSEIENDLKRIWGQLVRFYYFSIRMGLILFWPVRKIYWVLKYQFNKRILGNQKNEL